MKKSLQGGLGLGFVGDRERREAGREARINRAKSDPSNVFAYVMGPVMYDRDWRPSGNEVTVVLYAYDLLALEELWEKKDGLLIPKEGAGLSRDEHGNIVT
jgi:hypothetical protein